MSKTNVDENGKIENWMIYLETLLANEPETFKTLAKICIYFTWRYPSQAASVTVEDLASLSTKLLNLNMTESDDFLFENREK